jgi:pimeloyl-ACP methyl ester carboxylesterase
MKKTRREFLKTASAIGLAGLAAPILPETFAAPETKKPLDLAEWSFFWVGVEHQQRTSAADVIVNGKQMYVEYQIPVQRKHPYPIVLVHGGGGQGTDWMGTPDGRRGWSSYLIEEGYAVYIVDRPGHGRSPFHPDISGPFPQHAALLEDISSRFTPMAAKAPNASVYVKRHNQWPGTGEVGTPELTQLVAAEGGSYGPNAHALWRENGAKLLDKIGPAIIMTHSAGGPFGWLVAEIRPNLVKAIVVIEGGGRPFEGDNKWGLTDVPMAYDPPVSDPSLIKTKKETSFETGVAPYILQQEPARKLKNLGNIPMALVTAEASFASPGSPGTVAYLDQAGCHAEELRLVSRKVRGNGHMMMVEKNNREVLQTILKWIDMRVPRTGIPDVLTIRSIEAGPLKLADQGMFWVGATPKKVDYGTIVAGQMFVQYLIPAQVRFPHPVVLIHGGGGQMTHYFGSGDGRAGWAHYYLMAGYKVYLVDRVGHGRAPYHPDALGPISGVFNYASVTGDFLRAAPSVRVGTGDVGDPLIDQFQAGQNSIPNDNDLTRKLVTRGGAELLDKIGPAILQTHSAGGAFGWLIANERPKLTKAMVCVEGGGIQGLNVNMENLKNFPSVLVTAELSGRAQQPNQAASAVTVLKDGGCKATDLQLKDKGILGNGHFMMLESNRKQVFEAIRGWIEENVRT